MQHRLTIDYGDDILFSSGLTRGAFDEEARFLLAAKLYEVGRLSSGLAAKLCGKGRVDFLLALPRIGVAWLKKTPLVKPSACGTGLQVMQQAPSIERASRVAAPLRRLAARRERLLDRLEKAHRPVISLNQPGIESRTDPLTGA